MDDTFLDALLKQCIENEIQVIICGFDFDGPDTSPERAANQAILMKFTANEKGVFVDSATALESVDALSGKSVSQTTLFQGSLTLGDPTHGDYSLSIPVIIYTKTSPVPLPTGKKWSKSTSAEVPDSVTYVTVKEIGGEEVRTPLECKPEDLLNAYRYGQHLVPFSVGLSQHLR